MLPDRVSNPGPLTYESGVLPTALRGPAPRRSKDKVTVAIFKTNFVTAVAPLFIDITSH